ncbi:tRNA-splicing endonuclease subunit sen54 N-term-domain-containing protein [Cantharellus anzutake]|uniref:tRNA-splicing endonuclease subunit sen54 N-term-domain-containing protein n=1 Tax=Cantharellus anzutake TaxID=1750568 RepID=UPI001906FB2B|nr:tRNA-splicing endonuclease subunit sen54 N-term-domain-containing protein [Cantharellus anzutake]KAF8326872.1 tRNA-splicing endonuclease subunit sen54 N-term-domain-containing protein [Cantharellus anzutake]
MVDALKGVRGTSSKNMSYAVWLPGLSRAQVFQSRGIHFNNMGHSVRRLVKYDPGEKPRTVTRLELLPEEALYLLERGTLTCYKATSNDEGDALSDPSNIASLLASGATISAQQAYAEFIGTEDLTLERYQCYAYLKRLGFIITRAVSPLSSPSYPQPPPYGPSEKSSLQAPSIWKTILSCLQRVRSHLTQIFVCPHHTGWLKPLWRTSFGWLSSCDYPTIFRHLRIIPAGHLNPLSTTRPINSSPYKIFYHMWKPNSAWKKTAPPYPDFELIVIDGRTTPIPSIYELTTVFGMLPQVPPPLPRRKNPPRPPPAPLGLTLKNLLTLAWLKGKLFPPKPVLPTPHPFAAIRAGHKSVVIGVVDAGTLSFFRFAQGCLEEWPMM